MPHLPQQARRWTNDQVWTCTWEQHSASADLVLQIFCFPCIMHFIQLSDVPRSASCPICGDTIHEGMLKSVRYLDAETMVKAAQGEGQGVDQLGADATMDEAKIIDSEPATAAGGAHRIHMRLLHRPQMTTLALPATPTWPSDAIPPLTVPWQFLPDVLTYSRVMLATPEYMLLQLNRELEELKAEWNLLQGDDLGRGFVTSARNKVERQIGKVTNELMTPVVRHNEAEARDAWSEAVNGERRARERHVEREQRAKERAERELEAPPQVVTDEAEVPVEFLAASDVSYRGPTVHVPPNVVVEPNPMPPTVGKKNQKNRRRQGGAAPKAPPIPPAPSYYFYQSSLGVNVFLNPLDSRILLAHFHSYSAFPQHISFTTTGYDSATVSEDLRRRVKYLSHLPVGTEVVFVEADLAGIVSPEVLAQFEQPLKARRAKRRDRVRREDRDKRRAEQAERAMMPEMHITPSAQAVDHDHELAMALAASRLDSGLSVSPEVGAAFPLPGSNTAHQLAASPPSASSGSFAWAVHSRNMSSAPIGRREERLNMEGVEEAWSGFNAEHEEVAAAEAEGAGLAGGKKKKSKKTSKKLVLGGAGRQA